MLQKHGLCVGALRFDTMRNSEDCQNVSIFSSYIMDFARISCRDLM